MENMNNQSVHVEVLRVGKSRFDMCGQRLPSFVHADPSGTIAKGLVVRLVRFATRRLSDSGFGSCAEWRVSVYTMDADDKPSDRSYTVRFTNPKQGYVEVVGIQTQYGHPILDFGFEIGAE